MEKECNVSSPLVELGGFFFKYRSFTPIAWFVLLFFCRYRPSSDLHSWLPGILAMALGEGIRLWSVAVIGKESRTRGSGVARMVTGGPYGYLRNPLYVGNLLIMLGATLISELVWLVPAAVVLFFVQYVPVVLWEQKILREHFGAAYDAYCREVPAWIPCFNSSYARKPVVYDWKGSFWSERSTFATMAAVLLAMWIKEDFMHLVRYIQAHT